MSDRQPPHNVPAEEGVLGAVLLEGTIFDDVAEVIRSADDFWADANAVIWRHMEKLRRDGAPIDPASVAAALSRSRALKHFAGGDDHERSLAALEYLGHLSDRAVHTANATYHAGQVREAAVVRGVLEMGSRLIAAGYSGVHTGDDMIAMAEREVINLGRSRRGRPSVRIGDAAAEALARSVRRREGERSGVGTGIRELDEMIDGLRPGQLVVIAARPGMGKSLFSLNIAEHASADLGIPSYFATLEMTAVELGERALASRGMVAGSRVTHGRLRKGRVDPDEVAVLEEIVAGMRERMDLYIDDTPSPTIGEVMAAARRHKARYGVGLAFVDYLQLVEAEPDAARDSRQEQMAKVSRRLKLLAKELQTPVVAMSQLNRKAEGREDKRPMLSDLRETGAIEQDADMVILVHRPEYYDPNDKPGVAELILAKNRGGPTGTVEVAFLKDFMRFENLRRDEPNI